MSKGDGRELSSMMLSSQDFAATITKSDKGANSGHRLASTDAALGYFETPTATVHSCADPSQTPPALRVPSLATPVSPPVQAFEPDQSTAKKNSSFRTDSSPTSNSDTNITPKASFQHSARPIPILCTPRDPNRVITPLSGRGDRKGSDYFALAQSPSPRGRYFLTGSQQSHDGCGSESIRRRRRSSSSHLSRSLFVLKMHPDQLGNTRYTPTSPLSPRLPPAGRPVSPQPNRTRTAHRRQPSRNMQLNLGRFHPSNYQSNSQLAMESPASSAYGSGLTYQRMPQAESPRLMRERQRELIDRARLSSKIAASPMGIKPDRPTLAPLGSPKGNVTPLALEEGQEDYFQVGGAERVSPAQSPGAISNESTKEFGEELAKKTPKPEVFH